MAETHPRSPRVHPALWRSAEWPLLAMLSVPLGGCTLTPGPVGPPPTLASPNTLCFRPPYYTAPKIDGELWATDPGWLDSFRYVFENGTSVPDAIVQGVKDSQYVYLSFEVNNDSTLDQEDAIVMVFSPGGGTANDRRIILYPLFNDSVGSDGKPNALLYTTDSSTFSSGNGINSVAWLKDSDSDLNNDNVRVWAMGTSWSVEMRIPITTVAAAAGNPAADTGINFPASGVFGMAFDIIKVQRDGSTKSGKQRTWPEAAVLAGNAPNNVFLPEVNSPAASLWGRGALSGVSCNGVNVSTGDLYVEHPLQTTADPNSVVENTANVYTVRPTNSSVNPSGGFVAANGIDARFYFNDWGLPGPGSWTLVPQDASGAGGTNPTNLRVQIPAASPTLMGSAFIRAGRWTPTQPRSVCSSVELLSSSPGTTFVNHKGYNNLHFVETNSPFDHAAMVGAQGYKLPDGARTHEFTLRSYTYNTPRDAKWTTDLKTGDARTGRALATTNGVYRLEVPTEKGVSISTTIDPPRIRIPSADVKIAPGTGAQRMVSVPVVPSGLVTVYAQGSMRLRRSREGAFALPATPNGVSDPKGRGEYLLAAGYSPATRVGELIGSWDGTAKTSFPIGSTRTFRAPADARELYLGLNDTRAGFAEHAGEGFQVQVVATPFEDYYGRFDAATSYDWGKSAKVVPLGANLPTWVMCGDRQTGKKVRLNGTVVDLVDGSQCFAYIVRRIGGIR